MKSPRVLELLRYLWLLIVLPQNATVQNEEERNVFCFHQPECLRYNLTCADGSVVLLDHVAYDFAPGPRARACQEQLCRDPETCCPGNMPDCTLQFTGNKDIYRLFKKCSARQNCTGTANVSEITPPFRLYCNDTEQEGETELRSSPMFAAIEYGCVQENLIVDLCSNTSINAASREVHLMFKGSFHKMQGQVSPQTCSCTVSSDTRELMTSAIMKTQDVRLHRSAVITVCSSVVLTTKFGSQMELKSCDGDHPYQSFFSERPITRNLGVVITLDNLYAKGPDDVPDMVWIAFAGRDLTVSCEAKAMPATTDKQEDDEEDEGETDAGTQIAVIVVPVVCILILISFIILVVIWLRRRKRLQDLKAQLQAHMTPEIALHVDGGDADDYTYINPEDIGKISRNNSNYAKIDDANIYNADRMAGDGADDTIADDYNRIKFNGDVVSPAPGPGYSKLQDVGCPARSVISSGTGDYSKPSTGAIAPRPSLASMSSAGTYDGFIRNSAQTQETASNMTLSSFDVLDTEKGEPVGSDDYDDTVLPKSDCDIREPGDGGGPEVNVGRVIIGVESDDSKPSPTKLSDDNQQQEDNGGYLDVRFTPESTSDVIRDGEVSPAVTSNKGNVEVNFTEGPPQDIPINNTDDVSRYEEWTPQGGDASEPNLVEKENDFHTTDSLSLQFPGRRGNASDSIADEQSHIGSSDEDNHEKSETQNVSHPGAVVPLPTKISHDADAISDASSVESFLTDTELPETVADDSDAKNRPNQISQSPATVLNSDDEPTTEL